MKFFIFRKKQTNKNKKLIGCVKLLCKTNSVYYLKINAYIVLLSHTTLETIKANDIAVNPIFQGSTKDLFEVKTSTLGYQYLINFIF